MDLDSAASKAARDLLLFELYKSMDQDPPPILRPLKAGATRFVPGDGAFDPKVILVGEAPGASEDRQGSPFVGKSGRFLDELLGLAGLSREEVWVTNVVKYRPPGNRDPDPAEIAASVPLLSREIQIVNSHNEQRLIVGLGKVACSTMSPKPAVRLAKEHGTWRGLRNDWSMFISYHPAAGLRNIFVRNNMRQDFRLLREYLEELYG